MIVTSARICRSQEAPPPSADRSEIRRPESNPEASRLLRSALRSESILRPHARLRNGRNGNATASAHLRPEIQTRGAISQSLHFLFVAVEAGVNQARNIPRIWPGRGGFWQTLWRRLGGRFERRHLCHRRVSRLFRQDPRYYRLGDGGFSHRMGYAVTRILVTRQDSGRRRSISRKCLGSFSSAALAVTYYPKSERDFSDVAERAGVQFAFDAGFNVLKEFYPEIERKFFRRKRKHSATRNPMML